MASEEGEAPQELSVLEGALLDAAAEEDVGPANNDEEDCPVSEKEDDFKVPSEKAALSLPSQQPSQPFVMGNAGRKNMPKARDTQFYQVLNVSETWHRNHTLSKKDGAKVVFTQELLAERLDGYGYVAVELFDAELLGEHVAKGRRNALEGAGGAGNFRVRIKESSKVAELREKICEVLKLEDSKSIELIHDGKPVSDNLNVVEALKEPKMSWPKPYFGLVWVCPK